MQNISLAHAIPKTRKTDQPGSAGLYGQLLAPAVTRPLTVIEVIVGMALVFACCYAARPDDPLLTDIEFPWIWLAATVFALRYGTIMGVVAGLCVAAAWFFFYGFQGSEPFPTMLFVGGMAQLVIAGHFCDVWSARGRRLKAVNAYLDDSLVSITNNHYLLRVSHERLERDILAKPFTLRDAIERVRSLPAATGEGGPLPNAAAMLEFVANGCQISQASVFPVTEQGIDPVPVATVGAAFELDSGDALLNECMRQRGLAHLRQADDMQSGYLVCAPIMAASGHLSGVLVVRQMSFLSLNHDNLQLLLVLLNYYADGLEQHVLVEPVQLSLPQCPYDFALELARLARMQYCSGVRSALVGMVFPVGALGDAMVEQLMRQRRTLDLLWTYNLEDARVVIALLPLTDDIGVNGYLVRIEHAAEAQFNTSLAEAKVVSYRATVDFDEPGYGLKHIVSRCNRHG